LLLRLEFVVALSPIAHLLRTGDKITFVLVHAILQVPIQLAAPYESFRNSTMI
jgi:hypothetical protein